MTDQMVVVNGIRYRVEDAKRLGLVADPPAADETPKPKKATPKNKARKPAAKEG